MFLLLPLQSFSWLQIRLSSSSSSQENSNLTRSCLRAHRTWNGVTAYDTTKLCNMVHTRTLRKWRWYYTSAIFFNKREYYAIYQVPQRALRRWLRYYTSTILKESEPKRRRENEKTKRRKFLPAGRRQLTILVCGLLRLVWSLGNICTTSNNSLKETRCLLSTDTAKL